MRTNSREERARKQERQQQPGPSIVQSIDADQNEKGDILFTHALSLLVGYGTYSAHSEIVGMLLCRSGNR